MMMDYVRHPGTRSQKLLMGSTRLLDCARNKTKKDEEGHITFWESSMFQPADMMESFAAKSEKRDPEFDDLLPDQSAL